MATPQKYLPRLRGLVDARTEQEIIRAFNVMYNFFEERLKAAETQVVAATERLRAVEASAQFAGGVATPYIEEPGQELAELAFDKPLEVNDIPTLPSSKISGEFLLAQLDAKVLKTENALTEDATGAPNVNTGFVLIEDNDGNSIKVMTCA